MKIRYIMDVKILGEDYAVAMELHKALQGAFAEVLMERGLTTDGIKPVRLDQPEPGRREDGKG